MRGPVTIARYLDVTEAQLARVRLGGEDIEAFVIESSGFNPLLTGATGGVLLQVRERDRARAAAILAEVAREVDEDDEPDAAAEPVVRCPRCELEYCFHERARVARNAPVPIRMIVNLFAAAASRKRWHCRKCEHVWDDAAAGPRRMTRLEPGDPRPVFRLRRAHGGMGLFLGVMAGFFVAVVLSSGALGRELARGGAPAVALVGAALLGWLFGRSTRSDVCSEPSCRAALPGGADECPECKGTIAGVIRAAPEHHAAAADVRREIAAARASDALPAMQKRSAASAP